MQAFLGNNPLLALLIILLLGLAFGHLSIRGISLGTSGVLFVALVFGHFQVTIPGGLGSFGLVLFVYSVGLGAGPGFFRAFVSQGKNFAKLSFVIVTVGGLTASFFVAVFGLPAPVAAGLFAGALTSTPGLAAATEAVVSSGGKADAVTVAYGLAYPFGVIGVVLAVQLLPRLMRVDLDALAKSLEVGSKAPPIEQILVSVRNPAIFGKALTDISALTSANCQVTRVLKGERLVPLTSQYRFADSDVVLMITDAKSAEYIVPLIGERTQRSIVVDSDRERAQVVITSTAFVGKTLRELHLRTRYGITISRIQRHGMFFVPNVDNRFQPGDLVVAVGPQEGLSSFIAEAGHRERVLHETDLASLAGALVLGVLIGLTPIGLPGGGVFKLGLAGGPLLAGLLFGHFGRLGRLNGYLPPAARLLMGDIGLVLFLAHAGVTAGGSAMAVLAKHGWSLFLMGAAITVLPVVIGLFAATKWMKMDLLRALGGLCGGMTSTPAIGALTSRTDSSLPVMSYAAAYPVALILMGLFAQIMISALT